MTAILYLVYCYILYFVYYCTIRIILSVACVLTCHVL